MWIDHILCIHSSVDGHLFCFHFGGIIIKNNTAVDIGMQVFMWIYILIFLGFIPRTGIAWLYDKPVFNI